MSQKHILIVDDEDAVRGLLSEVLDGAGYRVTGVPSVALALEAVRAGRPDLIITDLQMDEADGFELIDALEERAPGVPVILLTGVLFDHAVIARLGAGKIAAYLEKTTSLDRILAEVAHQLAKPAGK